MIDQLANTNENNVKIELLVFIRSLGMQGISVWNHMNLDPVSTSENPMYNIVPDSSIEQQQLVEKLKSLPCSELKGLTKGQQQLCHLYKDHIPHIGRGAREGILECQYQFKSSRWNCSTFDSDSVFGPILNRSSKETSFAHAVSAAGVVHAIARACRDGQLSHCGCSRASRPENLQKEWIWGGCGDNIEYGYRFAESFIDLREKEKPANVHLTSNTGSTSDPNGTNAVQQSNAMTKSQVNKEMARKLMNLHNNEVGRRAVIKKTRITCKCHGVSGSCSVVTCWQQLSSFREIGDYLRSKYDTAVEVKMNKKGKLTPKKSSIAKRSSNNGRYPFGTHLRSQITQEELVYLDSSPDYCTLDSSYSTTGRKCNATSRGSDGCNKLCCGRGYNVHKEVIKSRCNCKFNWCCWVHCDTCQSKQDVYTCK